MGRANDIAVLESAIPTIKAALKRYEHRGDHGRAAKCRHALSLCKRQIRAFADAPPALSAAPGGHESEAPDSVLRVAEDKLVEAYIQAKARGDRDTMARLATYLEPRGLLPETPGLDHLMKRGTAGGPGRAFSAGYSPAAPAGSPWVGLVSGLLAARLQRK